LKRPSRLSRADTSPLRSCSRKAKAFTFGEWNERAWKKLPRARWGHTRLPWERNDRVWKDHHKEVRSYAAVNGEM
jgi:hypothetical protein